MPSSPGLSSGLPSVSCHVSLLSDSVLFRAWTADQCWTTMCVLRVHNEIHLETEYLETFIAIKCFHDTQACDYFPINSSL